jgi:hypothetical protein
MTFTDEEQALHAALADVTLGQPPMPVDRMAGVRRRHARRRAVQSVGAAVLAVVVAAGVFVSTNVVGRSVTPAGRSVPSWALPWPDHRDGSVSQQILDGAVIAWRQFYGGPGNAGRPTKVIWYAGQRAVNDSEVVVVFELESAEGRRLVAGYADTTNVDGSAQVHVAPGSSPWVLYDAPAPPPSYRGVVGLNLTASGSIDSASYDNWIVVLTHPTAPQISWSGAGLNGGGAATDKGLIVADVGQPTGQVYATVVDHPEQRGGGTNGQLPVGVPGNNKSRVPHLRQVGPLRGAPVGLRSLGEVASQGESVDSNLSFRGHGATTIYARCYGPGPIRVAVDTDKSDAGTVVPCDDRLHVLAGGQLGPNQFGGKGHSFAVHASDYTAWRVDVVAH